MTSSLGGTIYSTLSKTLTHLLTSRKIRSKSYCWIKQIISYSSLKSSLLSGQQLNLRKKNSLIFSQFSRFKKILYYNKTNKKQLKMILRKYISKLEISRWNCIHSPNKKSQNWKWTINLLDGQVSKVRMIF